MALETEDAFKKTKLDQLLKINLVKLQILNSQLKPTSSLSIASLFEALQNEVPIGIQKNGKNYLIDTEKAQKAILALTFQGLSPRDASTQVFKNLPLKGEMPQNYPESYTIDEDGIIFTKANLNVSKSLDKFYVSLQNPDLIGKKTIEVILTTHNPENSNSAYQDSVRINLDEDPENPGHFLSDPLVLVSQKKLDQDPIQGKDNILTDQTFLSELEGTVSVTYQEKSGATHTISAEVPAQWILPIQPIIFEDENGNRMATPEDVDRQFKLAQERLASAQIKLKILEPIILKAPEGITLKDGLTQEEVLRLAAFTYPYNPQPGLRVNFAGDKFPSQGRNLPRDGGSITELSGKTEEVRNSVFVSKQSLEQTLGHEIVHCLIDSVKDVSYSKMGMDITGHHFSYYNLLFSSPSGKGLFSTEHLAEYQILTLQKSPLLLKVQPRYNNSANLEYREGIHFVPSP